MEQLELIFGSKDEITWAQECARAALIFAYGLLMVRLAGRRMFGKWSAIDIVVSIIVGSNLSRALTGNAPLWGTLAATTVLMALHWVLARLAARWAGLSHLLEGRSVTLAENGQTDRRLLHRYAVTEADLNEALRQNGVEDVARTRKVVLEPSGRIDVLKP